VINASIVRTSVFAATLLAAALLDPDDARACSCASVGPPAERLAGADGVFRGTVIEVDVPWSLRRGALRDELGNFTGATVTVRLEVHEAWKGVHTREVVLDVGDGMCCNCTFGAGFAAPGEELLVYAHAYEGALHVSTCSWPVPSEYIGLHLEALGPGERSLAPGRTGDEGRSLSPMLLAGVIGGLLGLLGARRRARRNHASSSTPS
jgi:hypothetical protein